MMLSERLAGDWFVGILSESANKRNQAAILPAIEQGYDRFPVFERPHPAERSAETRQIHRRATRMDARRLAARLVVAALRGPSGPTRTREEVMSSPKNRRGAEQW